MLGSRRPHQKMITLDDFLKEISLRRELRTLNVEFQLHDMRKPRCFRPEIFRTPGGPLRNAIHGMWAEMRKFTVSIANAIHHTR